jgi:hypothetical protein
MRPLGFRFPALAALLLVSGCATADEWATWKAHPTHFASGNHLWFSARHGATTATRVTREDVVLARDQAWWGKPVTVEQAQIIER